MVFSELKSGLFSSYESAKEAAECKYVEKPFLNIYKYEDTLQFSLKITLSKSAPSLSNIHMFICSRYVSFLYKDKNLSEM